MTWKDCQEASWPADAPTFCAQLLLGVRGHRAAGVRDDQDPSHAEQVHAEHQRLECRRRSPGRRGCGRSWRRRAAGRASAAGRSGSPCRSRWRRPACATPSKPPRSKSAANSRFAAIRSSKSPTGRTLAEARAAVASALTGGTYSRRVRVSRRVLLASGGAVVVVGAGGALVEYDVLPGRSRAYDLLGLNGEAGVVPDVEPGPRVEGVLPSRVRRRRPGVLDQLPARRRAGGAAAGRGGAARCRPHGGGLVRRARPRRLPRGVRPADGAWPRSTAAWRRTGTSARTARTRGGWCARSSCRCLAEQGLDVGAARPARLVDGRPRRADARRRAAADARTCRCWRSAPRCGRRTTRW